MNDREVADYLLANPRFFDRHAELLAAVRLSNPHGEAAVSLQTRQMELLRDKYKQLEHRLTELLRHGHENNGIAAKLQRWTWRVTAERNPHALPGTITSGLREIFDVPQATLRMWDIASAYAQADCARSVGEDVRIFADSLVTPYCGANAGFEAAQWLDAGPGAHGSAAAGLSLARMTQENATPPSRAASVALIALRDTQQAEQAGHARAFGLLVLGSPDPRRFHKDMATDFLMQIGAIASAALNRLHMH
jgi:uncharacterized protein YigA (DUF484 family)